jgi:zinc protease
LIKQSTLNQVIQQKGDQIVSAQIEYRKLIYGNDFILSHNPIGNEATITAISIDDLKVL